MKFSRIGSGKQWLLGAVCGVVSSCIDLPIQQTPPQSDALVPLNKPFTTQNHIYEPNRIKTVQLYAGDASMGEKERFNPPVVALGQTQPLLLEFDQIGQTPTRYYAKVAHCDLDWKPSKLLEMEYINEINEFPLQQYTISSRTKTGYLHYKFTVPKVKLSGNYVLVVYRQNNPEDRVLVRRFMIYENRLHITPEPRMPVQDDARNRKQQIDMRINFTDYNVADVREDFKIMIRQNFRWGTAMMFGKPTTLKEFEHEAIYMPLSGENYFAGLNEYRRFDAKNVRFLGYRVGSLNLKDSLALVVETDLTREASPYFRAPDYNGNYLIGRQDAKNPHTEADYVHIKFHLKIPKMAGEVYVMGAFNDWQTNADNLMHYDDKKKMYEVDMQLKQGEYTYQYAVKRDGVLDEVALEGSHYITENDYDILIYHRPAGARSYRIVGYRRFNTSAPN